MAQNQNIGLLGQYLTVNTAANTIIFNSNSSISTAFITGSGGGSSTGGVTVNTGVITVGNSTVNVVVNSSSVYVSGTALGSGSGSVTSVGSGNGLTGGPITASGSLSVLANSGIVANTTGVFVNASYIATIAANSASYLGTTAAASYVQNTDSRTLSGNINFTGANSYFSGKTTFNANVVFNSGISIIDSTGSQGTAGQVLTSNGVGNVYWSSVSGGGGGSFTGGTVSGATTFNANVTLTSPLIANGAAGTSGYVLTSNGSTGAPYWSTVSSGGGSSGSSNSTATVYTAGTLLTGNNAYTTRWYPSRNITINKVRAWVITPGTQDVSININKNDVSQLSINVTSTSITENTSSFSATANDYITVTVSSDGRYAKDMYVSFIYS